MTTASIYYHNASSEPEFVLIDGDRANVRAEDYGSGPAAARTGARIAAIDHACRRLGWRVTDTAAIVRQADGRGTIRIEPLPELLAAADRAVDASNERTAAELSGPDTTAYVDATITGVPQTVSVDGRTEPVHTLCSLSSSNPANAERAVTAVHVALAALGYHSTGPIARRAEGSAIDHMRKVPVASDADWRDVPTMVRIDDEAARDLNELAATLGIPGDILASAWITQAAQEARRRHDQYTNYLVDHNRIKGWTANGTPHLDQHSGTISYAHRRFVNPEG